MAIPFFEQKSPEQRQSEKLQAAVEVGGKSTIMQHLTGRGAVERYRQGGYQQSLDMFRKQKIELKKEQRKQKIEIEKDLTKQIYKIKELKYQHSDLEKKLHHAQAAGDEAGVARYQERLDQARALADKHIEPLERHTWKNFDLTNKEQYKDIKLAHRERLREASKILHDQVRQQSLSDPYASRPAPFSLGR